MPVRRPSPVPHGRTARRLEWVHLPPPVRSLVERRTGSPVVEARSQTAGFTPGFASVLVCADGSRHFVKAASAKAQRLFAQSYREEARKLGALPAGVPAPRLRWTEEAHDWVVLGIEHVEGRAPHRPWTDTDLAASLQMLAAANAALTPPPAGLLLDPLAADLADWPGHWDYARRTFVLPRGEETAALARRSAEVLTGDAVVHTDVRDDNILVRPDGTAVLCDWNWPVLGPPWLDSLWLLVGPRGDGLDVEAVLADHPTFAGVPADAVDVALALLTGYLLKSADDPVPPTSPWIREHQRWCGDVAWDWLCERRGWETGE
ncbi:phosphotransferase family protein [Nocardioides litoris]|uniref:phosphotransferase family protein n=1 Tax=Nocardioides litoris TaxID=1926648 RepID=UPI0011244CC0|nr:phosphotransferase [Nocardioides litoris]